MHDDDSIAAPGHAPPHTAAVCTVRERVLIPSPHVTEQLDQAVNCAHAQSLGQQRSLHDSLSLSAPHVPPHVSDVCLARVRVRVPLPQVAEHDDHADHWSSAQSTAQHAPPHARDSFKSVGHTVPPHDAAVVTLRERVFVPMAPHTAEQTLHWDQMLTAQFCGQQPALHACISDTVLDEHEPPHVAASIVRVRN